jgi:hypothetical protein
VIFKGPSAAGSEGSFVNSNQIQVKGEKPGEKSKISPFASQQERKASLLCKKLRENI